MKKLVYLLSLVLLVAVTTETRAAGVGYLDMVVNGTVEKDAHPTAAESGTLRSGEDDLTTTIVSAGAIFQDKYKVGAEYGFGEITGASQSEDLSLWSVKAGYRLVNKLALKVDAIVAPLNINTDSSELRSVLYGIDAALYFSEKMFLTGSWVLGDATYEKDGCSKDNSVPIDFLRLKFHYFFHDKLGVVVGYTKLQYKFDVIKSGYDLGRMDVGMGGPTLGLVYKLQ
jgi:hypothetical protein